MTRNPSQRKGSTYQRTINTWLQDHGWTTTRRSTGEAGDDITATHHHHQLSLELKNQARHDLSGWLNQATRNAAPHQTPIVIIKRRGRTDPAESYALLTLAHLHQLIQDQP